MAMLAVEHDLLRLARYRERAREAQVYAATARLPEARDAYAQLARWWTLQEQKSWAPPRPSRPTMS